MKSELDDVIQRLRIASELVERRNGQTIDLLKERIFTKGPFLHQDIEGTEVTQGVSEEASAEFERNNPELFNFLRAFDDQLRDLF